MGLLYHLYFCRREEAISKVVKQELPAQGYSQQTAELSSELEVI